MSARDEPPGAFPPTLFLVVDAIPIDTALEVWERGGLPGFARPRPMISVFPSLTNVAVPALLGGVIDARPPGYESRYYDPVEERVRGDLSDAEAERGLRPYQTRPHGVLGHVGVYVLPRITTWEQIRWIRWRFEREGAPWLGYLSATDAVAHFVGREGLADALTDVGEQIAHARDSFEAQHGEKPDVVMCSDHGMAFGNFEHLPARQLAERLEAAGFDEGAARGRGFALAPLGDVAAGAVWCDTEHAAAVAEHVARAPGVDLAFARMPDGDGFVATGLRDGRMTRARVRWRGDRVDHEAEVGDPLELTELLAALPRDEAGWLDADVLAATHAHRYPDALRRVRMGLAELVTAPAAVLFSMQPGWTYGPRLVHEAARVRGGQVGTHGALSADQSLGFVTTCRLGDASRRLLEAPAVRADDVFRPFAAAARAGADLDSTEG